MKSYLLSKFLKNRKNKLISFFGIGGVLIGVFSIITVVSVMRGFENRLIGRILGNQPHIYILDKEKPIISNSEIIIKTLKRKDYLAISKFIEGEAILDFNNIKIGTVIFATSNDMLDLLKLPKLDRRDLSIGIQMAFTNQIVLNDEINLISTWDMLKIGAPKTRKFKIKDFVKTGTYFRDLKYSYMNIEDALMYFTPVKGMPTGIAIFLKNPKKMDISKLKEELSGYNNLKIETWISRNEKMFYALKIERIAMSSALFFIVLISSFSIIVSLVLMVKSRTKDFKILMAMGLTKTNLTKIISYLAIIKSSIGAVLGTILGTIFCYLLDKYKFISLPSIYYDTKLPVHLDYFFNISVGFLSIIISLIGILIALSFINIKKAI